MEDVFRALGDAQRRKLLDALFLRDGQRLTDLCELLPEMTRFGVMKHLTVLEQAGLVVARRSGREKHHYLNPVPIRLVHDRWISKFAEPVAASLSLLKHDLEGGPMTDTQTIPTHLFEMYIATTPDRLWQALTDPDMTERYYFGTRIASTLEAGAPISYLAPDGSTMLGGEVLEVDAPRRLVTTFEPHWGDDDHHATTRVTFEIEQLGAVCRLTLTHEVGDDRALFEGTRAGWQQILSGLKTLLETGKPLEIPRQT